MLDLNSFHHLPQLDTLLDEIASAASGLVIVAGFDARPHLENNAPSSGRGFMYGIVARQIMTAHPNTRTAIVTEEKDAQLRLSSRSRNHVRVLSPKREEAYGELLERAVKAGYPQVFAERFSRECYEVALRAVRQGRLIVTQMDTPLAGQWVARDIADSLENVSLLNGLSAVIAVQRLQTLCETCKQRDGEYFRAVGCDTCGGTGRRGEVSIFDIWRASTKVETTGAGESADTTKVMTTETPSVLSFRDYALELARQGLLSRQDVNELEMGQLFRVARLLSASERHQMRATAALKSQVTELQVASRTHEQQYLASFALQQVGHKLLELDSMQELAAYVCRRAQDLCGADRAVVYLLHHDQTAEIVALNGWDSQWLATRVGYQDLFRADAGEGYSPFQGYPPGIPSRAADVEGAMVRAQNPITRDFALTTLFPQSVALAKVVQPQWNIGALLTTTAKSWTETGTIPKQGDTTTISYDETKGEIPGPLNLGLSLTRLSPSPTKREQRVVVIGDADFLSNAFLGNGGNREFGQRVFDWLLQDDELVDIPDKGAPDRQLAMTQRELGVISLGFLVGLPALLLVCGGAIWWRRRRA